MSFPSTPGPIGVFDSGYGGLTILKALRSRLPQYDFLYLGDNARAPYGTRSFDVVYRYTRQCVEALFQRGCHLVILACNTASAKALRTIQQCDLPRWEGISKDCAQVDEKHGFRGDTGSTDAAISGPFDNKGESLGANGAPLPSRRVLGVIRPTAEVIGHLTKTRHIGIFATTGTILSHSYDIEIHKFFPDLIVTGQDCPMWVPLVENFEYDKPGADYFVKQRINQILERDPKIDTILLACTHYPLLYSKIRQFTPTNVAVIPQGEYVAASLDDYLHRHPEMEAKLTRGASLTCLTTENPEKFNTTANHFLQESVHAHNIRLD